MDAPEHPSEYEHLEGGDERSWSDYVHHPVGIAAAVAVVGLVGWGLVAAHPWSPTTLPSASARPSPGAAGITVVSTGDRGTVVTDPLVRPPLVRVELRVDLSSSTAGGGQVLGVVGPGATTPYARLPALLPGSSSVGLAGAELDCATITPDDPGAYGVAVVVRGRDGVEQVQGPLPADLAKAWAALIRTACAPVPAG